MELKNCYPMNITENKRLLYKLTRAESTSIKDLDEGTKITPQAWALYDSENNTGEINEVLAIETDQGIVVSTISGTFKNEFLYIADLMCEDNYTIVVKHGKTKNNRDYVTCELI